jgi:hypothetical protein
MDRWKPTELGVPQSLLRVQLADCSADLQIFFESRRLNPFLASILRSGEPEQVLVVTRKDDVVLYFDDVEDGLNLSPISKDGWIIGPRYEQDVLKWALAKWAAG